MSHLILHHYPSSPFSEKIRAVLGFKQLAWVTVVDIAAFFAILLIGFAYVWKRGDLDWVRAVGKERGAERGRRTYSDPLEEEQFLSA